jgi:hypothetical protein
VSSALAAGHLRSTARADGPIQWHRAATPPSPLPPRRRGPPIVSYRGPCAEGRVGKRRGGAAKERGKLRFPSSPLPNVSRDRDFRRLLQRIRFFAPLAQLRRNSSGSRRWSRAKRTLSLSASTGLGPAAGEVPVVLNRAAATHYTRTTVYIND